MSVPSHIGQYRILRKIGAGGMGMVFVGEHLLIQRRAAIKTLQPALSKHPQIVDRFFNEARALSAISDPGVVQIFDFGYHVDGTAYIVMELLEGEGLADRLDRLRTLPIPNALRIARQVASSLAAAHVKQIVHRDLKPENIFLIRDLEAQGGERTKVLDFGICALGDAPMPATSPETMIGTPVYMSPEQCRGGEQGDHRSDIYGLGCVLFQMLTGMAPFERDSLRDVIRAHLAEEPPLASSLRPDLPPIVDELVRRCLAKAPEDRYASMTELGAAIEHVLARLSGTELPVRAVTPAVALGVGFSSSSDAKADEKFAAHGPRLEDPTISCTSAAQLRGGPLRRAALGIALLGGAILASLAARLVDGERALASTPAAAAPATVVAPAAPPALAAEVQPAPVPAPTPAEPAEPAAPVGAAAEGRTAPVQAPSATQAPGDARPRNTGKLSSGGRAASRPAAPEAPRSSSPESSPPTGAPPTGAPPARPTNEDLYDMR